MRGAPGERAPLLENYGGYHRAITTRSPEAQRYFDQGLQMMFGFNLEEAQRSFEEAVRLDPQCAACQWGVAMSLGPHINFPATPERTRAAYQAARKAADLAAGASAVERALIEAVLKRYSDPPPADAEGQRALDAAYANAMRDVANRFPDDLDVATLFAEALMDLRPWDLWTSDGKPQPGTQEILSTLESVLARNPMHPGANHFYIHAVEASPHPEKALAAADRLGPLVPGFDFWLAYPSWALARFGRWEDVLQEPAPPADLRYAKAAWHGARGQALAAKGRLEEASVERDSVAAIAEALPAEAFEGFNSAKTLLGIATHLVSGEIAAKRGRVDEAVRLLREAVRAEDGLRYDEPSDWYVPIRHTLGAVLLAAGRAAEAQQVYEEDLKRNPENGWALFGLAESLRGQKKTVEAAAVQKRFEKAWQRADVKLTASRL